MMTDKECAQFLERLSVLIPVQAPNFTPSSVAIWNEALGLSKAEAMGALNRAKHECRFFPSIAELRKFADKGALDPEAEANAVADRVSEAVRRYGLVNGMGADAKEKLAEIYAFLGPIGTHIVKVAGGWNPFVDTITYDNLATYKAQWRKTAMYAIPQYASGQLGELPDSAKERPKIGATLDVIKALAEKAKV